MWNPCARSPVVDGRWQAGGPVGLEHDPSEDLLRVSLNGVRWELVGGQPPQKREGGGSGNGQRLYSLRTRTVLDQRDIFLTFTANNAATTALWAGGSPPTANSQEVPPPVVPRVTPTRNLPTLYPPPPYPHGGSTTTAASSSSSNTSSHSNNESPQNSRSSNKTLGTAQAAATTQMAP